MQVLLGQQEKQCESMTHQNVINSDHYHLESLAELRYPT